MWPVFSDLCSPELNWRRFRWIIISRKMWPKERCVYTTVQYIGFYFTATRTYCSELRIFIYIVHYRYGPLCIHCTVLVPVHIIISTDCRNIYCIPAKHNLSSLTAAITVCPSKLFILLVLHILYSIPPKVFILLDCYIVHTVYCMPQKIIYSTWLLRRLYEYTVHSMTHKKWFISIDFTIQWILNLFMQHRKNGVWIPDLP